jgi:hypothetical protein
MPVSGERFFSNCVIASRPPAEAPIATIGYGLLLVLIQFSDIIFLFILHRPIEILRGYIKIGKNNLNKIRFLKSVLSKFW